MRRTILLIDDDAATRASLAAALSAEGYTTLEADDGVSGLETFRATSPDLILLELVLPEVAGLDVCRAIRAESDVPIIMLTSRDTDIDKVVALEVGADDYVTKPFSFRELHARVRARLRRVQPAPRSHGVVIERENNVDAEIVRLGKVGVDPLGHRLFRDGISVPVTPRAFQLLMFLLRNPGQVFSREQLIERVWGYDYVGDTRTVSVHVSWLRMQIEDDPSDPVYLQTVRGVGYVLRLDGVQSARTSFDGLRSMHGRPAGVFALDVRNSADERQPARVS